MCSRTHAIPCALRLLEGAHGIACVREEAKRLLHPSGRLFILQALRDRPAMELQKSLAAWSSAAGLRLAPARFAPEKFPEWLLCVATRVDANAAAA